MTFLGNFTKAMKEYSADKLEKLTKYTNTSNAVVSYAKTKDDQFKVEVSLNNQIRAAKSGNGFYTLLNEVVDKLELQIKRYRATKSFKHCSKSINAFEEEYDDDFSDTITKEKVIVLDSIAYDEAIDEMELLGHNFYVYRDIDRNNEVCLVYKREDGSYGLIECR